VIGHDDAFLEDVALLTLGVLPRAEAERVAAHALTCDTCRTEYAKLRATADLVGYAAVEATATDGAAAARRKTRVMAAVRASSPAAPVSRDARRRRPYAAYIAAAAAAVIALASITNDIGVRRERAQERGEIATLQQRNASLDGALAELASPDSKRYPVPGGQVITHNGHVIVALRDLAPLPAGKVYQAWTLANGAKAVAPSITFSPDAGGVAVIELPQSAANLAAVAVSVEPAGGSKAPTSKPKFIRKLS